MAHNIMFAFNPQDTRSIYEQVEERFVALISSGIMAPGEQLPSVRSLAVQLAVNPNTIQRAYRELEARGYIHSQPGKGSFVAAADGVAQALRSDLLTQFDAASHGLRDLGLPLGELSARLALTYEGGNPDD